jgi:hypothetical protein
MKKILEKFKAVSPIYLIAAGIFLFGVIVLLVVFFYQPAWIGQDQDVEFLDEDALEDENCEFVRLLDGVCVESESDVDPDLVGVMVENHTDARPQSGLGKASVVYEAPVEANYSRFLLIYPVEEEVLKVGPVRSARPYYLDWLSEYGDIMYMHVGGSPDALDKIKEFDIFDLNEFYRGWYYWRSSDRYAPHNTYTSSKLWKKAWEDYGDDIILESDSQTSAGTWKFGEIEECDFDAWDCIDNFTVSFVKPTYVAEWKYNTSTQKYERYQMGYLHKDQDGSILEADTVIVQYVDTEVLDAVGRLGMETIGTGKAVIFRNGYSFGATWVKENRQSKTRWIDNEGNDMSLKPGKIWIEVLNGRGELEGVAL